MNRKSAVLLVLLGFGELASPGFAGCWTQGWTPYGSFMGGQHLGLGPGYPGIYPPVYFLPAFGWPWAPDQQVVVVPSPPVEVSVYPEVRVPAEDTRTVEAAPPAGSEYGDELARARRLYPQGLPGVEYFWSPGRAVIKLHTPSTPEQRK
jgi:hypothetical protein